MDKVNIILCTYNGEKYLRILLDSLLAQTYRNIDIYIRDDGSNDNTPQILCEYENHMQNDVRIHVIRDNLGNLGYVKNFLKTIRDSGDAEYYAFCDQDDYWLPDKIKNAVELLSKRPRNKCLLYSCAYETRNENLDFVSKGHLPTSFSQLDVGKALSLFDGGWLLGFTLVMNRRLKKLAFDNDAQEMYSHDIWTQAVAVGFGGELVYDARVGAFFRRHSSTTSVAESGVNNSIISAWKYRWDELFGGGKLFLQLKNGMQTYAKIYGNQIKRERDKRFLIYFGAEKNKYRFKKLFYPYRLKQSLIVELAWRIAIFFGKI